MSFVGSKRARRLELLLARGVSVLAVMREVRMRGKRVEWGNVEGI